MAAASTGASGPKCPICSKPTDTTVRPFCSKRCADVDLHRWLNGAYTVPASADDDDEAPDFEATPPNER